MKLGLQEDTRGMWGHIGFRDRSGFGLQGGSFRAQGFQNER